MQVSQVRWLVLLTVLLSYVSNSAAIDLPLISDTPGLPYVCAAMKAGRNTGDSFITLNLTSARTLSQQSPMAVAIFNFEDLPVLGKFVHGFRLNYCNEYKLQDMCCDHADLGLFYPTGPTLYTFITFNQTSSGVMDTRYDIEKDGKYCVVAEGDMGTGGIVHFNNSFGQLSVEEFQIMQALRLLFFFDIIVLGFYLNLVKAELDSFLCIHWSTIKLLCLMNIVAFFQWMEYEVKNIKSSPLYFSILCVVLRFMRDNGMLYFLALLTTRYGITHTKLAAKQIKHITYILLARFICESYNFVIFRLSNRVSVAVFAVAVLAFALGLIVKIMIFLPFLRTFSYLNRRRLLLKYSMYTSIGLLLGAMLITNLISLHFSVKDTFRRPSLYVPEFNEKDLIMGTFFPELVDNISFCIIFFIWRPSNVKHYFEEEFVLTDDEGD
ncbi:uncharacterized protein RNJ42_04028 [Nakaseomyces bracarensis]|uniref:uncharacterized protein n=1 Tax=Nakaseomyces bracarensis TaxID=273131 RepID=UPI00387271FE